VLANIQKICEFFFHLDSLNRTRIGHLLSDTHLLLVRELGGYQLAGFLNSMLFTEIGRM
jgi:hypothetical protein